MAHDVAPPNRSHNHKYTTSIPQPPHIALTSPLMPEAGKLGDLLNNVAMF